MEVEAIKKKYVDYIRRSGVVVPKGSKMILSHHYGIDRMGEVGAAVIECFNKEYCKKILVMLPGQRHPMHYHKRRPESFIVLHGEMVLTSIRPWHTSMTQTRLKVGDWIHLDVAEKHDFYTDCGCIFEEVSSREYEGDSYYDDDAITNNKADRKTEAGDCF